MFGQLPRVRGPEPKPGYTPFAEGYDTETPAWNVPPGRLRDALNYEIAVENGYQDIKGYERFDGRPRPSDASFTILDVTITGSIDVGDTVTGATSGATGRVIAIASYPDDPDQDYLVLTKVTDEFNEASENLTVSAIVEATAESEGFADFAPTSKLRAQYKNLAADAYRADIAAVPGQGSVWGVFMLGDTKYAFRNKAGGATAGLYRSTAGGWVEVTAGRQLEFTSGGTFEIEPGQTITGATSAATAVVAAIQTLSGDWAAGTAAGWLTLSSQTGTFGAENLNVGASANVATVAGNSAVPVFQPGGQLDYDISNFADPQAPERVYGVDGVNMGWEFDGTTLAFIRTGMVDDTPDHVIVHKKQLFYGFGASSQHSAPLDPFVWNVILGAGEIVSGEPITGYQVQPGSEGGGALLIAGQQRMHMLYGNDVDDWVLTEYRQKVGAYRWTLQSVAYTLCLDDRGITDFRTTQAFGNFDHSALSGLIRRVIIAKKSLAIGSAVVRDKNQYRLFFSDRSAIYVTMDGPKLMGMMPVLLEHEVVCTCSEENTDGDEEVYFGGADGFVYQMERGTSFDGEPIQAYLYTHFDNQKAIEYNKHYFAPVTIQARGSGYAEVNVSYELDYGRPDVPQPTDQVAEVPAAEGAAFDTGLIYDTFVMYDDQSLIPTIGLDLRGEGRNISWVLTKNSDYMEPLLLSGVHYRYIVRGPKRG